MATKCLLLCPSMKQSEELDLSHHLGDMSSIDYAKCVTVFEDGKYCIRLISTEYSCDDIQSVEVCVNGEQVGIIDLKEENGVVEGDVSYMNNIHADQPFLLHFDFVILSFILSFSDGTSLEYYTDYLICVSRSHDDEQNIKMMLQEMISFDDAQIGEWLFSDAKRKESSSMLEGKWNRHAYRSLSSFIQLLERIILCYRNNYAYFKTQGKHTISRSCELVTCDRVKTLTNDSVVWISQNADQLSEIPISGGIEYQRKNYIPHHVRTSVNIKSWDVYENRVVIGFLYTALLSAKQVYKEFDKDVLDEKRIISKFHGSIPKEYIAPIITIKSLQFEFCRNLLDKLNQTIVSLQEIYNQYMYFFDVPIAKLTSLPRKTSTFREIKPYSQVFDVILYWFQYGEYCLEKERLILQVKTLDKLYEYFCLLSLLKILAGNGFQKFNGDKSTYKYTYTTKDSHYQNERDVANTYILNKDEIVVTLYYQPVVSAIQTMNSLDIFRTTGTANSKFNYYTPDFILKFSTLEYGEEYVILDSKFSSRKNIKKHSLNDVVRKYSCEFGTTKKTAAIKMVWILQGRVKKDENSIWKYNNSPLAKSYPPKISYGIVSVNAIEDATTRFWNEMKNNIKALLVPSKRHAFENRDRLE